MKAVRYILGIILSLASFGLIILTIGAVCEFDLAYLEFQGLALIFASILFFVFILTSVFKARKWQGIIITILSAGTGLILMVNFLFSGDEFFRIIPFLFGIAIFLVYGIVIVAGANRQNLEKLKNLTQ